MGTSGLPKKIFSQKRLFQISEQKVLACVTFALVDKKLRANVLVKAQDLLFPSSIGLPYEKRVPTKIAADL